MAFVRRKLPLVAGVEAAGEVAAGHGVTSALPGDPVVIHDALTCRKCKACREGRDNLCENVGGIRLRPRSRHHAAATGHQVFGKVIVNLQACPFDSAALPTPIEQDRSRSCGATVAYPAFSTRNNVQPLTR